MMSAGKAYVTYRTAYGDKIDEMLPVYRSMRMIVIRQKNQLIGYRQVLI